MCKPALIFTMLLLLISAIYTTPAHEFRILESIKENDQSVAAVRIGDLTFLLYDKTIIGAQFTNKEHQHEAVFPGFAIMQASLYTNPSIERALQIGVGIGTVPTFLRNNGVITDAVEVSPAVIELAESYFGYNNCDKDMDDCIEGSTFIADGLAFLMSENSFRYDLVVVDIYTGKNTIGFFTFEILERIKRKWLSQNGLLVMNLFGFFNGVHSQIAKDVFQTFSEVFAVVRCFRDVEEADSLDAANLIFMGSDETIRFTLPNGAFYDDPQPGTYYHVIKSFEQWEHFAWMMEVEVTQSLDDIAIKAKGAAFEGNVIHDYNDTSIYDETHEEIKKHMAERISHIIPNAIWDELR